MYIHNLREEDIELSVKVVIVGNGGVGKSSMIQRYCRGTFSSRYKKTIGVDFLEKQLRVRGEEVRLMLWDTAGQEEFDALTTAYYRGAHACIVAFSTTDRDSLTAVRHWRKKVEEECGDIPMVMVQNKIDMISSAEIEQYEADYIARECKMKLYRTSVKDDLNVDVVFQHLAEDYVNKVVSEKCTDESQGERLMIGRGKTRMEWQRKAVSGRRGRGYVEDDVKKKSKHGNYYDPCTDYLNNPMFHSLHSRGQHNNHYNHSNYINLWTPHDKIITLRPNSTSRRPFKKTPCRVL